MMPRSFGTHLAKKETSEIDVSSSLYSMILIIFNHIFKRYLRIMVS